ncbi:MULTISPECIES: hypothetical protein [unclassified Microbacterium]|uniref:hypothetical protein n=1 Tax=unclassified Microbacterium TaxID=2609290 RepID=UPI00214C3ED5|nr:MULTISPECIES: hypothetical protein [unclassified Microbacterium]MCR2808389.1 hypothetical protein [Microbacterium sp. zg.B185]WIM19165.1 hypothetical protein QNO12_16565 [Microbacterium sp. zg-B185]
MTQTIEMIDPVTGEIIDQQQVAEQLLAQAKEQGVSLVGPGGLLGGLTKTVLESALEAELTERLGYDKHAVSAGEYARTGRGQDEVGPVQIAVRGIVRGRFSRRSFASDNVPWTGSMRSCCR